MTAVAVSHRWSTAPWVRWRDGISEVDADTNLRRIGERVGQQLLVVAERRERGQEHDAFGLGMTNRAHPGGCSLLQSDLKFTVDPHRRSSLTASDDTRMGADCKHKRGSTGVANLQKLASRTFRFMANPRITSGERGATMETQS